MQPSSCGVKTPDTAVLGVHPRRGQRLQVVSGSGSDVRSGRGAPADAYPQCSVTRMHRPRS
eukprot:5257-Chlamydomonas_euryale.AAC.3